MARWSKPLHLEWVLLKDLILSLAQNGFFNSERFRPRHPQAEYAFGG